MSSINWFEEITKRKDEFIMETQQFLRIKSVLDEENSYDQAPFGSGIAEALQHLLDKGNEAGFTTKNLDGYAGYIEFGEGTESVGVLCHIDVVPEGDGWTYDPYGAEIHDGKLYARGALDDKGPTMAAYYAMKIIKELGLTLNKRVRMIIGTDEESDWRCVDYYFKHEEMPTVGFAPDADFPIIYAEKGIADFDIVQLAKINDAQAPIMLESLHSGRRYNMVPDYAEAVLIAGEASDQIIQMFDTFLQNHALNGKSKIQDGKVTLCLEGISAHGMEPNKGKNAGLLLIQFLVQVDVDPKAAEFLKFTNHYFGQDSRGNELGVAFADDITGELTINIGKLEYTNALCGKLGLNLRYPVTNKIEQTKEKIATICKQFNMNIENFSDSKPHHVDKNHDLIKTLQRVYEEQTGEKADLISIGGGTYARSLVAGVAFGPLFPGRPDIAHEKDEHIFVEDLVKAVAIYAQAIYELAK